MRAYRLAGVPSPPATWIQWRVVAGPDEVSAKNQYAGDLWGLYVAMGDMEPKLLADKKLPDGLAVSIQSGIKHVPKDMTDAQKEWEKFLGGMRANPKEEWWRKNLDLPAYFSFHALNRLLGNVDLRPDGNHGYYRRPDGRWAPIPWDIDMMFVPRHHQPGHIDAIRCLNHPAIALEYRNRAREILDLFAADRTATGGQIGQLAADLGARTDAEKVRRRSGPGSTRRAGTSTRGSTRRERSLSILRTPVTSAARSGGPLRPPTSRASASTSSISARTPAR